MEQINQREESRAARFLQMAMQAWAKNAGLHQVEFAPPFNKLNVELKINDIEVPFTEVLDAIYVQLEADINRRAERLMQKQWDNWLEKLGERGDDLLMALRHAGQQLGNMRALMRDGTEGDE